MKEATTDKGVDRKIQGIAAVLVATLNYPKVTGKETKVEMQSMIAIALSMVTKERLLNTSESLTLYVAMEDNIPTEERLPQFTTAFREFVSDVGYDIMLKEQTKKVDRALIERYAPELIGTGAEGNIKLEFV